MKDPSVRLFCLYNGYAAGKWLMDSGFIPDRVKNICFIWNTQRVFWFQATSYPLNTTSKVA